MARWGRDHGMEVYGQPQGVQQFLMNPFNHSRELHSTYGEFWREGDTPRGDCRVAASVANILGHGKLAGAESFSTGKLSIYPEQLKMGLNRALAGGINYFELHTLIPQPYDVRGPGFTGLYGLPFSRHRTWWPYFDRFNRYAARCVGLLRRGATVAELLFLVSDDVPKSTAFTAGWDDSLPVGVQYHMVDGPSLHVAEYRHGEIRFPSGAAYGALVLPTGRVVFRLETLRKVAELGKAGAPILLGDRPLSSPSFNDLGEREGAFQTLVKQIWKGGGEQVRTGVGVQEFMGGVGLAADVETPGEEPFEFSALWRRIVEPRLHSLHRRDGDTDIFFLANPGASENPGTPFRNIVRLHCTGRRPELWDAVNGIIVKDVPFRVDGAYTEVPLELDLGESVFVVFREPLESPPAFTRDQLLARLPQWETALAIGGPWTVRFNPELNAPAETVFEKLISYTEHPDENIRYYSSKATYVKEFDASADLAGSKSPLFLNLGKVKELAEVRLNGESLGVLWTPPWRVEVTGKLKPGKNLLEVDVINTWHNRMVGEIRKYGRSKAFGEGRPEAWLGKQPAAPGRLIYAGGLAAGVGGEPLPAGLLGPVRIERRHGGRLEDRP